MSTELSAYVNNPDGGRFVSTTMDPRVAGNFASGTGQGIRTNGWVYTIFHEGPMSHFVPDHLPASMTLVGEREFAVPNSIDFKDVVGWQKVDANGVFVFDSWEANPDFDLGRLPNGTGSPVTVHGMYGAVDPDTGNLLAVSAVAFPAAGTAAAKSKKNVLLAGFAIGAVALAVVIDRLAPDKKKAVEEAVKKVKEWHPDADKISSAVEKTKSGSGVSIEPPRERKTPKDPVLPAINEKPAKTPTERQAPARPPRSYQTLLEDYPGHPGEHIIEYRDWTGTGHGPWKRIAFDQITEHDRLEARDAEALRILFRDIQNPVIGWAGGRDTGKRLNTGECKNIIGAILDALKSRAIAYKANCLPQHKAGYDILIDHYRERRDALGATGVLGQWKNEWVTRGRHYFRFIDSLGNVRYGFRPYWAGFDGPLDVAVTVEKPEQYEIDAANTNAELEIAAQKAVAAPTAENRQKYANKVQTVRDDLAQDLQSKDGREMRSAMLAHFHYLDQLATRIEGEVAGEPAEPRDVTHWDDMTARQRQREKERLSYVYVEAGPNREDRRRESEAMTVISRRFRFDAKNWGKPETIADPTPSEKRAAHVNTMLQIAQGHRRVGMKLTREYSHALQTVLEDMLDGLELGSYPTQQSMERWDDLVADLEEATGKLAPAGTARLCLPNLKQRDRLHGLSAGNGRGVNQYFFEYNLIEDTEVKVTRHRIKQVGDLWRPSAGVGETITDPTPHEWFSALQAHHRRALVDKALRSTASERDKAIAAAVVQVEEISYRHLDATTTPRSLMLYQIRKDLGCGFENISWHRTEDSAASTNSDLWEKLTTRLYFTIQQRAASKATRQLVSYMTMQNGAPAPTSEDTRTVTFGLAETESAILGTLLILTGQEYLEALQSYKRSKSSADKADYQEKKAAYQAALYEWLLPLTLVGGTNTELLRYYQNILNRLSDENPDNIALLPPTDEG